MSHTAEFNSLSIAFAGSGGAGVMTAGTILLDAAAASGWHGLMTRSLGPQIRGGEAAALLRLASHPVECHDDAFDLLIAVDWHNFGRFAAEIPLTADSLVIADAGAGLPPVEVTDSGCRLIALPFAELIGDIAGGRPNMLALGIAAAIAGVPGAAILTVVNKRLGGKGAEIVASSTATFEAGTGAAATLDVARPLAAPRSANERWLLSGNQATAFGALKGGVRFVAAYPITPATDILEWMAPRLPPLGGTLVQAEDEIASVNMLIGASFGGVPALTATSGPGLALMSEGFGLAVAAEVPLVVVDVMRCGPSTGIATKSEQADLNLAVYGLHGDAPHLVVAPGGIADCARTAEWTVRLAEHLQCPAILLSDQNLGQARATTQPPDDAPDPGPRLRADAPVTPPFPRYRPDNGGISPMSLPGQTGGQYTGEGLSHGETGAPSNRADDHRRQIDKRQRKLETFDFGDDWADVEGDGALAIITWGSTAAPVREAIGRLGKDGQACRLLNLRLLLPAQPARLAAALDGVRKIIVIEQSASGQLHRFLRAHYDLPAPVHWFGRPGPLPFRPGEIADEIRSLL